MIRVITPGDIVSVKVSSPDGVFIEGDTYVVISLYNERLRCCVSNGIEHHWYTEYFQYVGKSTPLERFIHGLR